MLTDSILSQEEDEEDEEGRGVLVSTAYCSSDPMFVYTLLSTLLLLYQKRTRAKDPMIDTRVHRASCHDI